MAGYLATMGLLIAVVLRVRAGAEHVGFNATADGLGGLADVGVGSRPAVAARWRRSALTRLRTMAAGEACSARGPYWPTGTRLLNLRIEAAAHRA
jgi:hypothetical protein